MLEIYWTAAFWLFLAIISTILANHLKMSTALMEICIGAFAGFLVFNFVGEDFLKPNSEWLKFIASTGAIILIFLAGTELDPNSLKKKFKESSIVGFIGFLASFGGCTLIARYLLHWDFRASLLAGIALSTTSMAVVYAVMLEYGFNKTEFGKGILGSCFVNDLGTVLALGLIFSPFTKKTVIFIIISLLSFYIMPFITSILTHFYGFRTPAIRTKWILFVLFSLGALAIWSGSEKVLPAYIAGMVLAGTVSRDLFFIRRIRTLTIGFLTPFYFLRAGVQVSLPSILKAPLVFLILLSGKVISKIFGLYPVIKQFRKDRRERWYYTLLMSTGLTFGTIASLYGLTHGIVSVEQYSYLVAVIIGSAVIPTVIANSAFLPKNIQKLPITEEEEVPEFEREIKIPYYISFPVRRFSLTLKKNKKKIQEILEMNLKLPLTRHGFLCYIVKKFTSFGFKKGGIILGACKMPLFFMKNFFIFLLIFCTNLFSSIEGILIDQKGKPLPDIKVELNKEGLVSFTDGEGKFTFPGEMGSYEIIVLGQVYKINFKDYPVKIVIKTFGEMVIIEPPGSTFSYVPEKIMEIPKMTLSENLIYIPKIHLNGLGGVFQTISISGMAKQRIQVEVMGYKIEGLRRAGTDFGTFHPDLFDSLNLYETGLGFTHGSNAMGGTVDFQFKQYFEENLSFNFSYGTNNKSKSFSTRYSNEKLSIFSGFGEADFYQDGSGKNQPGYFKRGNLLGTYKLEGEESQNFIDFIFTKGWDIGKPFLSDDKTDYPRNNLHLLGFRGTYKNLNYQFGTYYQDLETTTTKERSFFKNLNIQGKIYYFKGKYSFGFETNSHPLFYANNKLSTGSFEPLKDGKKYDFSYFSSYENYLNSNFKFFAGLRFNYFKASNLNKEKEETIPGIFLKFSKEGNTNYDFSLYNIYRFPSIEELFYSGLTARGYVQGNEKLKSEKGYGVSFQLKRKFNEGELGFSVSYKNAKNFIERYKVSKDLYSYRNTDEVEIYSGDIYFQEEIFFANLSFSKGKNKETGGDIDDQKPLSINAGFFKRFNKLEPFLFFTLSDKLKNPGPNELERDKYFILNLGTNFYIKEDIYLSFKVENLTDEYYTPQGDNKAVPQMGRNFILSFLIK